MGKTVKIAVIAILMVLLTVSGLCGQHYLEEETSPVCSGAFLDYVRGVYILREVDNG